MKFKSIANKNILIIGGNSDIGKALALEFSKLKTNLTLTTRNPKSLESFASDIEIRFNTKCNIVFLDVIDFNSHLNFYKTLEEKPDIVITCVGYLDNQWDSISSWTEAQKSIQTNFTGLVSLLNIIANDFETRKYGLIAGISSVAGDRGRASNYIYGCSKAGYSTYLDGLRNRLYKSNVHVVTIKPGFVKTKMTKHLRLPKKLTHSTEGIANDIVRSIEKRKNTIYTKWIWKWIMLTIKLIPEKIFKRLNI